MKPDLASMLADAAEWQARTQPADPVVNSAGRNWYNITNNADRAQIRIYDEIGGWGVDADTFANDLSNITAPVIEVGINSPGGSVFEGLAIYNALRTHAAYVVTRVDGLAASAASFIAQAGDERVMVGSSQMMIHDARAVVYGDAPLMREAADFLDRQSANIAALYAERSGVNDEAHYAALMAAETWMTAAEAVEHGLADNVLTPARQTNDNRTDLSPHDAHTVPAATAAGSDVASLVEPQHGERAAYLRTLKLPERTS